MEPQQTEAKKWAVEPRQAEAQKKWVVDLDL